MQKPILKPVCASTAVLKLRFEYASLIRSAVPEPARAKSQSFTEGMGSQHETLCQQTYCRASWRLYGVRGY
eukprot:6146158-Amphidinium_carterae.1